MVLVHTSGGGVDIKFDLDDLIPKLESLRTLIVYASPYAERSLLFYHLLPHFSRSKNIFIAVYSDTMYRRLEKTYESISHASPEIKSLLEEVKIIKIGRKKDAFGELYQLITPDATWHKKFVEVAKRLGKDDVLLFHGFSIVPIMYGEKAMVEMLRLLDEVSEDLTLINKCSEHLYDETTEKLLERFYDVVVKVERDEESFLGFEETYTIGVYQSIVMEIRPGFARFRIGEDGRLVKE